MEPKDGVKQVRMHGRYDRTSVYVVDGLLIDCGPVAARRAMDALIEREKPSQAVLTHYHEQHSGNADLLNKRGIVPFLDPAGIDLVGDGFPPQLLYRRFLYGRPAPARFQPLPEVITTGRYTFQVIPLPGHCPGHVGFYEPEREWLFAGDLYSGTLITSLKEEEDLEDHIASYERLRSLPIRVLFCSHIGSITDPKYLIENKWYNLTAIRDAIVGMKNRRMKFGQIKRAMRMKEGWRYYLTQGDFAKTHFITSVLEHRD
jgi:glyoxylase-like metal-dependent hydrolase (beta-lactamase superfamily II)